MVTGDELIDGRFKYTSYGVLDTLTGIEYATYDEALEAVFGYNEDH